MREDHMKLRLTKIYVKLCKYHHHKVRLSSTRGDFNGYVLQLLQLYFLKYQCYLYDLLYKEEHDILLHPTLCGTCHFVTQSNVFFVANG